MNERIRDQYNSLYATQQNVSGEEKHMPIVERCTAYLSGDSVLDLGGGEGRNALYLAQKGCAVTVYDISEVGIERLRTGAQNQGFEIETRVVDITEEPIEDMFDAVINTFVLHHIDDADARRLIAEAQTHTAQQGVHVLSTFANKGALYDRNEKSNRFYPSEAKVRELYADWDIRELSVHETTTHARHKNGERMKNDVLSMIAVRNNG